MALRRYWTGLRTSHGELEHNPPARERYCGPGWEIVFLPVKEKYPPLPKGMKSLGRAPPPRDLYILARSVDTAQYVASLLFASKSVLDGVAVEHLLVGWDPYVAIPTDPKEIDSLPPEQAEVLRKKRASYPDFSCLGHGFYDAALVASRLARRASLRNAAFKYLLSVYLVHVHPMDLHPLHWTPGALKSSQPMHWVWFSQGLFSAFGVLEELGLKVNGATAQRPSIRSDGTWEPALRADLEIRLERTGVPRNAVFGWHVRGAVRRLEQMAAKRITQSTAASYSTKEIRDINILYIDAINIAQMMRNNVAAHVGDLAGLTAIDVANVQQLARMLLLRSVKFHFWELQKSAAKARMQTKAQKEQPS